MITKSIPLPRTVLVPGQFTYVMGVINTTPDSFSDGGVHLDPDVAIQAGVDMIDAGAHMVDVGGESTRPGSEPIDTNVELERAIPVIRGIMDKRPEAIVSIDTRRSQVAAAAIEAGVQIINDVSGFRDDPQMIGLAHDTGCAVIVMHMLGKPKTMQQAIEYNHFPEDIVEFFKERIETLQAEGIAPDKIIVDPGIGFGKTFDQNLILINRMDLFKTLGKPVLIGPSRKSFIGKILDLPEPADRDLGTMAVITAAILRGADIVRVHSIPEAVQVSKVADAVIRERVEA
jgi:dihydropteroate synthase